MSPDQLKEIEKLAEDRMRVGDMLSPHLLLTIKAILLSLFLFGAYAPNRTREAVAAMGFKDIEILGPAFFACGKEYTFSTEFAATNPSGIRVKGVACCGWIMGCSLRF